MTRYYQTNDLYGNDVGPYSGDINDIMSLWDDSLRDWARAELDEKLESDPDYLDGQDEDERLSEIIKRMRGELRDALIPASNYHNVEKIVEDIQDGKIRGAFDDEEVAYVDRDGQWEYGKSGSQPSHTQCVSPEDFETSTIDEIVKTVSTFLDAD